MRESDPDDSSQDALHKRKKGLYSQSPMDILSELRKKHGRHRGIGAQEKHAPPLDKDGKTGLEEKSLQDYFPPGAEDSGEGGFEPVEVGEIIPREKEGEQEPKEHLSIRQKVEGILKSPKRAAIEKTPSKITEFDTNSLESYDLSAKDFGGEEAQEGRRRDYDYAKPEKRGGSQEEDFGQEGEFEGLSGTGSYGNPADDGDESEKEEKGEKTIHDYDLDEDDFAPRTRDALSEFEERTLEHFETGQKIENLPRPPILPKARGGRRVRVAPEAKYFEGSGESGKSPKDYDLRKEDFEGGGEEEKSIEDYGLSKEDFDEGGKSLEDYDLRKGDFEGEEEFGKAGFLQESDAEYSAQSEDESGADEFAEDEKTLHDYDLDEKDFEKNDSAHLFASLSKGKKEAPPAKLQVSEIGAPIIEAEQIPKELQDEIRLPFAGGSSNLTAEEEEQPENDSDWEVMHAPQSAQAQSAPQEAEFEGEEQFTLSEPIQPPSIMQMHLVKKGGGGLFASRPKMLNMNTALYREGGEEPIPPLHSAGAMAHIKKSGGVLSIFSKKPSEAGQLHFISAAREPPKQPQKIYQEAYSQNEKIMHEPAHEKNELPQIFQPLHLHMPKVRKSGAFGIFAAKPKQAGALEAHAGIRKQKKKEKKPSLYCPSMHEVKKSQALPFFSPSPKKANSRLLFYQPKKRKKAEKRKLSLPRGSMHLVRKSAKLPIFSPSPKTQNTHLGTIIKKEKKKIPLPEPQALKMHPVHQHLSGQIPFFAKEPKQAKQLHEIKLEQKRGEPIAAPRGVEMHHPAHSAPILHIFEKKPAHAPSSLRQMPLKKPIPPEVIMEKQDTKQKEKLIEEFFTNSPQPQGKAGLVQKKLRTPLHPVHVKMQKHPSQGWGLFRHSQKPDAHRGKFNPLHEEQKQNEISEEKKQREILQAQKEAQEKKQSEILQERMREQEKIKSERTHARKESRHKMFAGLFSPSRKHAKVEDFSHVAGPVKKAPAGPPSRLGMRRVPQYSPGFSIFKSGPHPLSHREKFSKIKIEQPPKRQPHPFYRPQATGMQKISAYREGFSLFGKAEKPAARHIPLEAEIEEQGQTLAEEIKENKISQIHETSPEREKPGGMKTRAKAHESEGEILQLQPPAPQEKEGSPGFGDFLKGTEIGKPAAAASQTSPSIMPKKGAKISQPGIMDGQRAILPSEVSMPSTKGISKSEWNSQYRRELSRPVPTRAQVDSYYESSPIEQKKYLHALSVEEAYWKYANSPKSSKKHLESQQKFMAMLENSSPEQRVAIEQCINLTKAVSAVSVFTNPSVLAAQREEAHAIYISVVGQHPDLHPLVQYQVARLALMKAHNPDSFSPPADYLQFMRLLDDDLRCCAHAMRAAFLDRIMNNKGASQPLREWAAKYYSQILLAMPHLSAKLGICLKVHRGFELFFASQAASTLEEERVLREKWQRLANEDGDVRLIIFYELATIFYGKARGNREEEEE